MASAPRDLTLDEAAECGRLADEVDAIDRSAGDRPLTKNQTERRAAYLADIRAILDRAAGAPGWTGFTAQRFAETGDPADAREAARLARADAYARQAADFRGTPGDTTMRSPYRDVTDDSPVTSFRDLIQKYNARGFAVAEFTPELRALTTSGNTVPTTFHDRLTIYERDATPMLDPDTVSMNVVQSGESHIFPLLSADPAHGGTVTAEAGVINAFDPTIGSATATPYKYAAITQWSSELDTDNVINLETAIAFSTGRELALDIGVHLTTGDGSSKPTGWITNATNAGTATGGTATQGFDYYAPSDLPALFMAVAKPYRQRGIWQASSTMYQKILEWRDSDGVPIALPLNDSPSGLGIYGRPLVENPALAAVGSATKSIGFGDFGRFEVVRLPVRVELSRDATIGGTSLFQTDQVAIRVIERVDGRLVDTAAVAYQVAANS